MKFYLIEEETVLAEEEQYNVFASLVKDGFVDDDEMPYSEWLEDVLHNPQSSITDELDMDELMDNLSKVKPTAEEVAHLLRIAKDIKNRTARGFIE